jgi:hypothetical protein
LRCPALPTIEQAIDEYGISFDEIIGKLDDSTVIDAIYRCCEISGLYAENDNEVLSCTRCGECEGECLCEEND